jgi:Ca2+-binding RTX toxin-like protein
VVGLGGDDVLYGGSGRDFVYGYAGADVMYGGDGNDVLLALGGERPTRDWLFCGSGKDQYAADNRDIVSSNCERKVLIVIVD